MTRLLPVALVDLGLALVLLGIATMVRPLPAIGIAAPSVALATAAVGLALAAGAALLPAADRRAAGNSALDRIVPIWQFDERHEIEIAAPPERVAAALRAVTAREIRGFLLLTWLRNPARTLGVGPESILAPAPDRPILDVALSSGFTLLCESSEEVVIGMLVLLPERLRRAPLADRIAFQAALGAERFARQEAPGFAAAVMAFRWTESAPGVVHLVTETRIATADPGSRRRFGAYWRLIYPGSSLIRSAWLDAIRSRAESSG